MSWDEALGIVADKMIELRSQCPQLANIWYDDRVAVIDPGTGAVAWFLDFAELKRAHPNPGEDVLNGLAYTMRRDNAAAAPAPAAEAVAVSAWGGRLWVTGKFWNRMYEVELGGFVNATDLVEPQFISRELGGTAAPPVRRRAAAKKTGGAGAGARRA